MPRKRLTETTVQNLPFKAERYELRDTDERLWIRVSPSRIKTWLIYYKVHGGDGRQRRMNLGRFPKLSAREARDKSRQNLDLARAGIDPAARAENTFRAVAAEWFATNTAKPGTKAAYESILRLHLNPNIGNLPLHEITTATLAAKVTQPLIKADKRGIAHKVKGVGTQVYKHAFGRGLVTLNPFEHLQEKELNPKNRKPTATGKALKPEDVRKVWELTDGMAYPYEPYIRLLLLTGQRRGDWLGARWDEFDGDWWTIPPERYKTDTQHRVFIAPLAREVLDAVPRFDRSPLVFCTKALKENKLVPAAQVGQYWAKHVQKKLGQHYRVHDMRHTVATVLAENVGIPQRVIRAVQGHSESGIGATYTHAEYEQPRRDAMLEYEKWVRECLKK